MSLHLPSLSYLCDPDINLERVLSTVSVGQGEYIVFRQNSLGEAEQITKDLYLRVYSVFNQYSAMELMDERPDEVFIRDALIAAEVKKIDPTLESAFIPRTLYELFYIAEAIKEDREKNKICIRQILDHHLYKKMLKTHEEELGLDDLPAPCSSSDTTVSSKTTLESLRKRYIRVCDILEKEEPKKIDDISFRGIYKGCLDPAYILNEKNECWHMKPFMGKADKKHNAHPRVMDIAYRLNEVIIKLMRPTPGGFTLSEIVAHAKKITSALKESSESNIPHETNISSYLGLCHIISKSFNRCFAIENEKHVKIIIRAVKLECTPAAKDHTFIFRGGNISKDSIENRYDKTHTLSFGCGLFAGSVFDETGTPWYFARRDESDAYAIPIHFNLLRRSPFWIPATNTLVQLFSTGEVFHPRTLIPAADLKIDIVSSPTILWGVCLSGIFNDALYIKEEKTALLLYNKFTTHEDQNARYEWLINYMQFLRTPLNQAELSFLFKIYKRRAIILNPEDSYITQLITSIISKITG